MALATAPDVRSLVVNGLTPTLRDYITTTDQMEAAVRVHLESGAVLPPALRSVLARLVTARDAFLDPLVREAEEGR